MTTPPPPNPPAEEASADKESQPPTPTLPQQPPEDEPRMDAASALHSLGGDEDDDTGSGGEKPAEGSGDSAQPSAPDTDQVVIKREEGGEGEANKEEQAEEKEEGEAPKRYLPEHKKPDAAPTFPEKLMKLMRFAETQGDDFCVAWMEDGKSFIIRSPDEFTRNVVPKFFKPTKFSSFTRKLYRWGFRQVNRGIGPDDPIIFGNDHFQRDRAEKMANMRSVTAAATRKEEQKSANATLLYAAGMKHPLDGGMVGMGGFDETTHKRLMIEHMYHHKAGMMGGHHQHPSARGYYGGPGAGPMGMGPNGAMSLTSALRPNMGMPPHPHMGGMQMPPGAGGSGGNNPAGYDYMGYQGGAPPSHPLPPQGASPGQHPSNSHPSGGGGGGERGGDGGSGGGSGGQPPPPPYHHHPQYQSPQGPYGMPPGGPPHHPHYQQQQHGNAPGGAGYPNPSTTAEIVNAAIAALRYAN